MVVNDLKNAVRINNNLRIIYKIYWPYLEIEKNGN